MSEYKVFHLITRMIRGGADENTAYTVNGLDKSLFDVDMYAGVESDMDKFNDLDVKIIPDLIRDVNIVRDFKAFCRLFNVIRKNKYDIVHTHTAKAGILGRWAAYFNRVPIIIHTLHGATFHESIGSAKKYLYIVLEKMAASFTDRMISVGDDLSERYIEKGIGKREKYVTIRSGMKLEKFFKAGELSIRELETIRDKLDIRRDRILITQIARLEERKGYKYLVEASKDIIKKTPEALFLIAGEGDYKEQIQMLIDESKMNDYFRFLGYREDVEKIIAISDLVVLTSLWEGLPRILVQASAVGRPVVTFAVEGAREVVKEGINGYVVDIEDTSSLAKKVILILEDLDKARKMGIEGRKIIGEEWNVDNMVKKIEALYKELIEKSKKLN